MSRTKYILCYQTNMISDEIFDDDSFIKMFEESFSLLNEGETLKHSERKARDFFKFRKGEISLPQYIHELSKEHKIVDRHHDTIESRDIWYRKLSDTIDVPSKTFIEADNDKGYIKHKWLWNHYKFLEALPQPEQKSKAWFDMRNNFITASAAGNILHLNGFEPRYELLLKKIGEGQPFGENKNVYHGKKYEPVAILIYEYMMNVKVGEFGLVSHIEPERIDFIGASPDGICSNITLDGKFSPYVGRMLEIKCVTTRPLNVTGEVYGVQIPKYYELQTQIQMECTSLEECDFWQCKLIEYEDKDKWLAVVDNELKNGNWGNHTRDQGIPQHLDSRCTYGTIIELYPKDRSEVPEGDEVKWYGKFLYHTNLQCSLDEKLRWSEYMEKSWKEIYPQFAEDYEFERVVYWHLEQSIVNLVMRDRPRFAQHLPAFREFWDEVLEYRENPDSKENFMTNIVPKLRKAHEAQRKKDIQAYWAKKNAEEKEKRKSAKKTIMSEEEKKQIMELNSTMFDSSDSEDD
jgi:putative phage-type endonuclease